MSGPRGGEITVRPIADEDVPSFHLCLDAVARERRFLAMVEAPPLEALREFVASGRERGAVQFVATSDGGVVGWCDVSPIPFEGCRHCGTLGMGVLTGHRRRGTGRRLLESTLREAERCGITRVELEVFASNRAAIRLYEAFGFEHEGRKHRAREIDGVAEDLVCMARIRIA
ncbi:MAG: GNAT family N-acetyltransferase [Myxococcales bacterium]|nr:GNAT family N-acetyltransferase [Myxococcales bacterium]